METVMRPIVTITNRDNLIYVLNFAAMSIEFYFSVFIPRLEWMIHQICNVCHKQISYPMDASQD